MPTGEQTPQQGSEPASSASASASASASPRPEHSTTATATNSSEDISSSHDRRSANEDDAAVVKKKSRTSPKKKATIDDFEMIRVLGKGCAGKVLLVRHHDSNRLFAMKSIHKRHVLAHQELQHTLTEQAVLKRMAREVHDPFVVRLWWSFHDKYNLYLVMDFHPGGDLATQLSRWGRLGRDRARFYAAEIVEGVEGLHRAGVIYRDLKPENVLIGADGHIVLSDFGLSKEFPREAHSSTDTKSSSKLSKYTEERDVTSTFCGTAEYLAPEVIQGAPYSYEVDWWSFGTMLYEMLTGITPFWADTHADMYVRVLHDELVFPEDRVLDQDTKSILRGLLQRNPALRMRSPRIKRHPYFSMIEWAHVCDKRYIPPYIPPIDPLDEMDTQNFDEAFLDMPPTVANGTDGDSLAEDGKDGEDPEERARAVAAATAAANAARGAAGADSDVKSLFDGYSYRGRRDSESIRSSIMSNGSDEPADDDAERDAAMEEIDSAIEAALATPPRSTSTPVPNGAGSSANFSANASPVKSIKSRAPSAPPASVVRRSNGDRSAVVDDDDHEEEDDSAARAAVAALDRLEREAETNDSSSADLSSRPTMSTLDTSYSDTGDTSVRSKLLTRFSKERNGNEDRTATTTTTELDEEDEDWDLLDNDATIGSEVNGGKGQSLWARGVVDTYRLLRRNESSNKDSSEPGSPALHSSSSYRLLRRKDGTTRGFGSSKSGGGNSSSRAERNGSSNSNGNGKDSSKSPSLPTSSSNGSNGFSSGAFARLGTRSRRGLSQVAMIRRKP
ncbi:hypothetical protein OC846_004814 [Tilletia horrida]|uniref:Protein kinase domain-containing protein n=1 Tax=Tilletia horrida TaxID=155126 RepID=A0AAN6JWK1_9BASI|nr:hypothetical protein OC846_004814 [Tilletia horrida]KAK0562998.1 hypothetical protein OC861_005043 [Tilletia horrida]